MPRRKRPVSCAEAIARLVVVIQVCSQCGTRWNVRDRQRTWCPRCHGTLLAPADAPIALLDHSVGAIDEDLREACSRAVELNRLTARAYAERYTWDAVGERFLSLLVTPAAVRMSADRYTVNA